MRDRNATAQKGINSKTPTKTLKLIDNRYEIKDIYLGEGSFGQVFACWDTLKKEVLAAKSISKARLLQKINSSKSAKKASQFYVKSIQDEAYLMKRLDHPNILKLSGYSETNSSIYLYLEYCNQGTLFQKIQKKGRLDYEEAIPIMKQLISGCLHMHEKNICHRDIKPQNILLHNGVVKISDFGFAVSLDDFDSITSQTCVGTDEFIAPQILSKKILSDKCDVWSLGVTFYNMIYGNYPWVYTCNLKQWQQRLQREIYLPNDLFIPSWIKTIILKMLIYEQELRPSLSEIKQLFL